MAYTALCNIFSVIYLCNFSNQKNNNIFFIFETNLSIIENIMIGINVAAVASSLAWHAIISTNIRNLDIDWELMRYTQ